MKDTIENLEILIKRCKESIAIWQDGMTAKNPKMVEGATRRVNENKQLIAEYEEAIKILIAYSARVGSYEVCDCNRECEYKRYLMVCERKESCIHKSQTLFGKQGD